MEQVTNIVEVWGLNRTCNSQNNFFLISHKWSKDFSESLLVILVDGSWDLQFNQKKAFWPMRFPKFINTNTHLNICTEVSHWTFSFDWEQTQVNIDWDCLNSYRLGWILGHHLNLEGANPYLVTFFPYFPS